MIKPLSGGFFDDEANPIQPCMVARPGLCLLCNYDETEDAEENLLCMMNRWDQRNDEVFVCGKFEKKK
ncbi:MAG: hypothetical protein KGZ82_11425 [Bacteroidales bacterium]|nr:hypothetical protein [Bacteroidales bacterium]